MKDLQELQDYLRTFSSDRDWQQFQSPKNLVMALSVEVAELMEHFQWLTEEESRQLSPEQQQAVADEIADVQMYLVRLADELGVDILAATAAKRLNNEKKYPVEKVKGSAKKYTAYRQENP